MSDAATRIRAWLAARDLRRDARAGQRRMEAMERGAPHAARPGSRTPAQPVLPGDDGRRIAVVDGWAAEEAAHA